MMVFLNRLCIQDLESTFLLKNGGDS